MVTWLVSYLISVLFSQICCDTWVQVGWTTTIGNFENVVDLCLIVRAPSCPEKDRCRRGDWRFDNLSGSHHKWNQLPLRLPKRQSQSTTAVLFKLFTPGSSDRMISCFLRVQTVHLNVEYMVDKISHGLLLHSLSFKKLNVSLAFKSENVQGH